MKRIISIVLACALILGCSCTVWASGFDHMEEGIIETEAEKVARVQAEVLSGNITNDRDVIEVALAEYLAKRQECREKGIPFAEPQSLTITQTLAPEVDVNGETVHREAVTALLVVDDAGEQISPLSYYIETHDESGSLEDYYLLATQTTYLKTETHPEWGWAISVQKVSTVFEGDVGMDTTLIQYYVFHSLGEDLYVSRDSGVVSVRSEGVSYTYYPGDTAHCTTGGFPYFEISADISRGSERYRLFYHFDISAHNWEYNEQ